METDPVKSSDEIEDVLSSIRRLVSEHHPAPAGAAVEPVPSPAVTSDPAADPSQTKPDTPAPEAERLVLTAALRVTDPDDPWRPVPRPGDVSAEEPAAVSAPETEPRIGAETAFDPEAEASADPASDPLDLETIATFLNGQASSEDGSEADMEQDAPRSADAPDRDGAQFASAADVLQAGASDDEAADVARASKPDVTGEIEEFARRVTFSVLSDVAEEKAEEATADREAADQAQEAVAPDVEPDAQPEPEPETEAEPVQRAHIFAPEAAAEAQHSEPEPEPEPETPGVVDVEDLGEAASPFTFPDAGFDELDEETLREIIAEVVREELQGALGERITRNVRKMVRREIRLALAAEGLD